MKYTLSKRQMKEIANGKTLRIALPAPDEEVPDLTKWIRAHLWLPPGTIVWDEQEVDLPVYPLTKPTGLGDLLGQIANRGEGGFRILVCAIVFNLSSRRAQRGQYPTQWPGSVTLDDGRTLPHAETD